MRTVVSRRVWNVRRNRPHYGVKQQAKTYGMFLNCGRYTAGRVK